MAAKGETSGELKESDAELAARAQHAIAGALGVKPFALSYTQVLDLERLPHPAFLREPRELFAALNAYFFIVVICCNRYIGHSYVVTHDTRMILLCIRTYVRTIFVYSRSLVRT